MGFYPCNKSEIARTSRGGQRMIVARCYDDVLAKWVEREFLTSGESSMQLACQWVQKQMMQLDM